MNIAEVLLKLQDIADAPFDRGTFALKLIEAYAPPKSTIAKLRHGSLNKADRETDLLWPKRLHVRLANGGEAARELDALSAEWTNKKNTPRLLVAVDGAEIAALDTKLDDPLNITIQNVAERYDFFLPLGGVERYQGVPDSPADIKAAGRLATFYDAILEANPDWTAHRRVHELNLFLTRILFCMFAQSTGIFPKDLFSRTLNECTSIDGNDTQSVLEAIFEALDLDEDHRGHCAQYAKRFPYVNGGLFRDRTGVPRLSRIARRVLIDTAKLNWTEINPDIFGSMIQAVVKPGMRDELGMHYTSVPNIMKVLSPLFLDKLEQELSASGNNPKKLEALLAHIRRIRVFDPACGSGNFLIIAYKELCKLEMKVFELLQMHDKQIKLPFSEVQLENFIGIELEDFAVETAKLSLYIAQHQMNVLFKKTFGFGPPDLPLRDSGRVVADNATRLDWLKVCPPDDASETYIAGNPPYLGMTYQKPDQKADVAAIFDGLVKGYKELDYVACWLIKAADYCKRATSVAALVTTNSICQGEMVPLIWPQIFKYGVEIGFAHRSFKWKNNATNNAGVTCIIIGLREKSSDRKRIFDGNLVRDVKNISPYLIEGDDTIVTKRSKPLSALGLMLKGNQPTDGGHLILAPEEREVLLQTTPKAAQFLRRYVGSQEFIKGIERWCIWIEDTDIDLARSIPEIKSRLDLVRDERLKSPAPSTVQKATSPHRFIQIQDYGNEAIIIPAVSSESRPYLQIGLVGADVIINNRAFAIYNGSMSLFSILSSRMHCVWTHAVAGRLEERLNYANTIVWNTFPVPDLSAAQTSFLEEAGWSVLAEREKHPGKTIADLYDVETMPPALLAAHRELDEVLENIYIGRAFVSDAERLEHLFKRYKLMVAKEQSPLFDRKRRKKVGANG